MPGLLVSGCLRQLLVPFAALLKSIICAIPPRPISADKFLQFALKAAAITLPKVTAAAAEQRGPAAEQRGPAAVGALSLSR